MKKAFSFITIITIFAGTFLFPQYCYAENAPLFTFDYGGRHIETYVSYSVVNGETSTSHRFFVKSGQLVVIDQSLDPTADGIFIHFEDGKSYIVVLCRNGKIVSLGTENVLSYLEDFTNSDIKDLAENISYDSTTLLFSYENGSHAAYDCITGELLYRIGGSAESSSSKGLGEYVKSYVQDFLSTGGNTNNSGSTAGAKAQGIVNTLESTGVSLDILVNSGAVDGIAANYENGYAQADYTNGYDVADYVNGYETGTYTGGEAANYTGVEVGTGASESGESDAIGVNADISYDYTQNEEYAQLMESKEAEWSDEEVNALKTMFAGIASGNISSARAKEELFFTEEKTEKPEDSFTEVYEDNDEESVEYAYAGEDDSDVEAEKVDDVIAADDTDYTSVDETDTEDEIDSADDAETVFASLSPEDKNQISETFESIEQDREEYIAEVNANTAEAAAGSDGSGKSGSTGEKKYIKSEIDNKYVAVYNAKEERYDIYSQADLLDNPQNPEDAASHIVESTKLDNLKQFLSDDTESDVKRGIRIYIAVAACVVLAVASMFFIKPFKKKVD